MSTTILVTGGGGFIGSHIVDQLVARGDRVRVLDSFHPAAHAGRPAYLNNEAELLVGDIRDPEAVREAVEDVDSVCHQAAMVGLGTDFHDVGEYVSINGLGTANLLAALHERAFAGRMVLAGSMVVYGEGGYLCEADGAVRPLARTREDLDAGSFDPRCPDCGRTLAPRSIDEATPPDPRNVYAATKLHQEHLFNAFAREHPGAEPTILRYHNVYGPRMPRDTPYAGVASIFRSSLEAGKAPVVFEDGAQLRDFIHVGDVARANVLALSAGCPVPGVFNVATGRPHSIGEMAAALAAAAGPGAPAPRISAEYRLGDVRHVFADPGAAAEHLGFSAEVEFADGMREFATAELRSPTGGGLLTRS